MKRILINAAHLEEVRVALCENNKLYDFDLENRTREQKKSNIYKGHVTRVEPSLESVFVEYGSERQGFLPLREIGSEYLRDGKKGNMRELIKEGDELIIQVEKEERGNKGAALSTYVSLAGRYLVLMPTNSSGGGISRQITGQTRDELKRLLSKLKTPKSMSVIIRTAGVGRSEEELQADLDQLLHTWKNIKSLCDSKKSPCLAYQEAGMVTRAVRDYLREDIAEVWIDHPVAFEEVRQFVEAVMPHQLSKVKRYIGHEPIFTSFRVDSQIETAYEREVKLPSGGSIVIDQTEALVSIDINSAKATRGADIESTATHTNLEAAEEIARQLRIRDMGGLVVIDFIDMNVDANQRKVEQRLKDATSRDRARLQFASISRFGLMEMSRQRLRPSLEETTGSACPRCHGTGMVRDIRSLSLTIMRDIEKIVLKEARGEVQAEVPLEIGAFLLNEKRETLLLIEQDSGVRVTILPNASMETPHYNVRFKPGGFAPTSYERVSNRSAQESAELGYDTEWLDQPTQIAATPSYNSAPTKTQAPAAEPATKTQPAAAQPAEPSKPAQPQYAWLNKSWKRIKSVMLTPVIQDDSVTPKSASDDASADHSKSDKKTTRSDKPSKQAKASSGSAQSSAADQSASSDTSHADKPAKRGNRRRSRRGDKNESVKTGSGAQSQQTQDQDASALTQTGESTAPKGKAPQRERNSRRSSRGPRNRDKTSSQDTQSNAVSAQPPSNQSKQASNSSEEALKMQVIENPVAMPKHDVITLDMGDTAISATVGTDPQGSSTDEVVTIDAAPKTNSDAPPTDPVSEAAPASEEPKSSTPVAITTDEPLTEVGDESAAEEQPVDPAPVATSEAVEPAQTNEAANSEQAPAGPKRAARASNDTRDVETKFEPIGTESMTAWADKNQATAQAHQPAGSTSCPAPKQTVRAANDPRGPLASQEGALAPATQNSDHEPVNPAANTQPNANLVDTSDPIIAGQVADSVSDDTINLSGLSSGAFIEKQLGAEGQQMIKDGKVAEAFIRALLR